MLLKVVVAVGLACATLLLEVDIGAILQARALHGPGPGRVRDCWIGPGPGSGPRCSGSGRARA